MGMIYTEQHSKNTLSAQPNPSQYTTAIMPFPEYRPQNTQTAQSNQFSEQQRMSNTQWAQQTQNSQNAHYTNDTLNAQNAQYTQCTQTHHLQTMPTARLQKTAPTFTANAVVDGAVCSLSLESLRNHYVALVFYPRDFSSLCAAELQAFSDRTRQFDELNCKIVAVSTDSELAHLAFRATPQTQGGLPTCAFPLVSDTNNTISAQYGVLLDSGAAMRATYIIDPCGIVRSIMINDIAVARNIDEVVRCVAAIKTADEKHCVCPVNWTLGCKTIQPQLAEERLYFPYC